jgi:hypothetical protein
MNGKEKETSVVTFRLTQSEYEGLGVEPNKRAKDIVKESMAEGWSIEKALKEINQRLIDIQARGPGQMSQSGALEQMVLDAKERLDKRHKAAGGKGELNVVRDDEDEA